MHGCVSDLAFPPRTSPKNRVVYNHLPIQRVGWLDMRRRRRRWLGESKVKMVAADRLSVVRSSPRIKEITPVWVESIPKELEYGKLYINASARTLWHLCPCGCGETVTTSVHPDGWVMLFDGVHVTLQPSIGNPHQMCRSHYYIVKNKIVWCKPLLG